MALKDFMARGVETGEGRASSVENTPEPSVRPPRPAAPPSCIDAATEFEGRIQSSKTIRIDGRVKGEVHCGQTVVVGESANIEAVIHAASVVISGAVKGDLSATSKITLQKTARVTGDLRTPGIVIEEGAMLEGRIVIGPDEQPAAEKKAAARTPEKPRESATAPPAQGPTPPGP
jgi:cytoskeletal protein CcmA (bactofilin family)